MKVAGIIAEYNPFHNGHLYLINKARGLFGADYVIAVMSGNYVERGEPAVFDKYARTECALKNGADVVIELPVIFSTASAEIFSAGAVSLLNNLGVVDILCFGSECGDIKTLSEAAALLSSLDDNENDEIKKLIKSGISYPAAVTKISEKKSKLISTYDTKNFRGQTDLSGKYNMSDKHYIFSDTDRKTNKATDIKNILSQPNNVLAIEYIKAINNLKSDITPVTVKRFASDYNDLSLNGEYSSASAIRKYLCKNITGKNSEHDNYPDVNINKKSIKKIYEEISHAMPENCVEILSQRNATAIFTDDFSQVLGSMLVGASHESLSRTYDLTSDLANKIYKNITNYTNIKDFTALLKSKDLTYNYIVRALTHFMLNIDCEAIDAVRANNYKTYARLLGFKKDTPLLSSIKANTDIPIISKFADAYASFTGLNKQILDINLNGDRLYRMVAMNKSGHMLPTEFESNIVII